MTPGEDGPQDMTPGGGMTEAMLSRLEAISATLDQVSARIEAVARRERETARRERATRKLTWGLAASFVLDIVLTVVVTVLTVNALNQSATIHQSQLTACAIGNQTRDEQITLWSYVINLSRQNPDSNRGQLDKFQQFVMATFRPVNCAKVYRS